MATTLTLTGGILSISATGTPSSVRVTVTAMAMVIPTMIILWTRTHGATITATDTVVSMTPSGQGITADIMVTMVVITAGITAGLSTVR